MTEYDGKRPDEKQEASGEEVVSDSADDSSYDACEADYADARHE